MHPKVIENGKRTCIEPIFSKQDIKACVGICIYRIGICIHRIKIPQGYILILVYVHLRLWMIEVGKNGIS